MVGPGTVVSEGLWRVTAQENRTGVANVRGQRLWILDREFEMLGSDPVREARRLFQIAHPDQSPPRRQSGGDDGGTGHLRQQALDTGCDTVEKGRVG